MIDSFIGVLQESSAYGEHTAVPRS